MTLAIGRPATLSSSGVERFTHRIAITDALVVTWAVVGAHLFRFGTDSASDIASTQAYDIGYVVVSGVIIVLWLMSLRVHNAYDPRIFGHGPEEYRGVATATIRLFVSLAVLSYVFKLEIARGYLLVVLPAGTIGLLLSRWLWRRWLSLQREVGHFNDTMLVVGDRSHLTALVAALAEVPSAGYRIVGACCSDGGGPIAPDVPILGDEEDAAKVATTLGADVVACSGTSRLGSSGLRRLGWDLEGTGIGLVLAPGLTQVAGPRILTRPVAGLPLLHVEAPTFTGPKRAVKRTFDWFGALFIALVLSPLIVTVALLIRRDGGPAFYRQTRVGMNGETFQMVKFRSMVVDADKITSSVNDGAGPLFKLRVDPRVTPLGRFIRRTSIDEIPQLWNVLRGEMSLVGPRPPLAKEVERYGQDVHRRLLVPPGMTGLWQVSGRSDLAWDDAVRLDLYYVENWNLVADLKILFRTAVAVVRPDGAY